MLEKNKKLLIGGATGALVTGTALAIALPLTLGSNDNKADKLVDKELNQKFENILSAPGGTETKAILESIFSAPADSNDPTKVINANLVKVLTDYLNKNKKTLSVKAYTKEVDALTKTLLVFTNKTETQPPAPNGALGASYAALPKDLQDKMAKSTFALYTTQAEKQLISSEVLASPNPGSLVPQAFATGVDYISYEAKLIKILSELKIDGVDDAILSDNSKKKAAKVTVTDFIAATASLKTDGDANFVTFVASELAKASAITLAEEGQTSLKVTINYSGFKKELTITGFKDKDAASPQQTVDDAKTYFEGDKDVKDNQELSPTFKADPTIADLNVYLKTPLTLPDGVTVTIAIKTNPVGEKTKQGFTVTITSTEDSSITATADLNLVGFVTAADINANAISGDNVTAIINSTLSNKTTTSPTDAINSISTTQTVNTFTVNIKDLTPNAAAGTITYKYDILQGKNPTLTKDITNKEGVVSGFKQTATPADIIKSINNWMTTHTTLDSGSPQVDPAAYDETTFKAALKAAATSVIPSTATIVEVSKGAPGDGEVTFTYKVKLNSNELSNEGTVKVTGLKGKAAIADAKVAAAQTAFNSAFAVTTGDAAELATTTKDGAWPASPTTTLDALATLTGKTKPILDAGVTVTVTPTDQKELGKLQVVVVFSATDATAAKTTTVTVTGFKTQAEMDYSLLNSTEINKAVKAKKAYTNQTDPKAYETDVKAGTDLDNLNVTVGSTTFTVKVILGTVDPAGGTISYTTEIKDPNAKDLTGIPGSLIGFKTSATAIEMETQIKAKLSGLVSTGYTSTGNEAIKPGDVKEANGAKLYADMTGPLTGFNDFAASIKYSVGTPNETDGSIELSIEFTVTDEAPSSKTFTVKITVKGYRTIILEKAAAKTAIDTYFGNKTPTVAKPSATVPPAATTAWNQSKADAKTAIDAVTTSIADVEAAKTAGKQVIDAALTAYNGEITKANDAADVESAKTGFTAPTADSSKLPTAVTNPGESTDANTVKIEYTKWDQKNSTGEIGYTVTFTKGTATGTTSGTITGYKKQGEVNQAKVDAEAKLFNGTATFAATTQTIAAANDKSFTANDLGIAKPAGVTGTVTYSHVEITSDGPVDVTIKVALTSGESATKTVVVTVSGIAKLKANALIDADKLIVDGINAKNPSVAPRTAQISVGDPFVPATLVKPADVPTPAAGVTRTYGVKSVDKAAGTATIDVTISVTDGDNKTSTFTVGGYITDAQKAADVKANAVTDVKIQAAFSTKVGAANLAKTADDALAAITSTIKVDIDGVEITLTLVADNDGKKISWTSSAATLANADPAILTTKNGLTGEVSGFLDPAVDAQNKKVDAAFAAGAAGITSALDAKLTPNKGDTVATIIAATPTVKVTVSGLDIELDLKVDPSSNTSIKWSVKTLEGVDNATSSNKAAIKAFEGVVTGFTAPVTQPTAAETANTKAAGIEDTDITGALEALVTNKAVNAVAALAEIDSTSSGKVQVTVDGVVLELTINANADGNNIDWAVNSIVSGLDDAADTTALEALTGTTTKMTGPAAGGGAAGASGTADATALY